MAKFVIVLKSGYAIPIQAKEIRAQYSQYTNELCGIAYDGVLSGALAYLNLEEVAAIYKEEL